MISATDQALIKRVQTLQCQDSFSVLVERHQSDLRYSLRQMTNWDEGLADDLSQETFLKAYQSIKTFKGSAKFSSWLYRIAYNLMISHFRVARNREVTGVEILDDTPSSQTRTETSSQQDLHRDLARAMKVLPATQRMALHLNLHRELTHSEISYIMEMPLGTVKTAINRGKITLRQNLAGWNSEETR